MKLKDFNLLKKIMDRTLSENDHEALASLRAANKIIADSKVTWGRFFDRSVQIAVEDAGAYYSGIGVEEAPREAGAPRAREAESDKERKVRESFEYIERVDDRRYASDFIQSLLKQWEDRKWLSDNQLVHLFRSAEEARSKRGHR